MPSHFRALLVAVQFLTRVPVPAMPAPTDDDLSRAALYYPAVGLLIGIIFAVIASLLNASEALLVSALLLVLWITITGALHLDGLADSADAWMGGLGNLQKTHTILKDPLVGTAGMVAVICIILIKYSALYALIKQQHYFIIMLAPVLGRAMILLLFTSTDYIRKQGLASGVIKGLNERAAVIGLIPVLLIAAWFSFIGLLVSLLVFIGLRKMMISRLGGCTGDTAGASVEIIEAAWLCAAALALTS
jgi:adenosylcobinamide-GDP ribazoletransferase